MCIIDVDVVFVFGVRGGCFDFVYVGVMSVLFCCDGVLIGCC